MAGTNDAAQGDTAYVLTAPLPLQLGREADGRGLWVANVDAVPNQVTVDTEGSIEGHRRFNLTGKGDTLFVPAGDVTIVTISANVYPTTVGWAFLAPHMAVTTGQTRA